jgi:hypothetical protein
MDHATALSDQQRLRELTLLIAQLAAHYDMTEGELAAAAGGACAVSRLLRRTTAMEQGTVVEDIPPEALVMLFDSRMRLPVVVHDGESGSEALAMEAPAVAIQ